MSGAPAGTTGCPRGSARAKKVTDVPQTAAGERWRDRHVLVTGGTSGIGLAATQLLLAAGSRVTAVGLPDRYLDDLAASGRPGLTVAAADVTDPEQLAAALAAGRTAHGPLGALITCAGVVKPGYFTDLTDADLREHMEVNYFGTVHPIRLALPDLLQGAPASITCVSSAAGFLGVFGYGAYGPSKFAVRGLCEVLRQELRPRGITVTVVCPTDVDTPMLAGENPRKPPELRALSSGEKALSAQRVARDLLAGTAAGRAMVLPGTGARALHWAAGAVPGLVARYMDHTIARTRAGDTEGA
jgi:3-dehydrosphinganine reductase